MMSVLFILAVGGIRTAEAGMTITPTSPQNTSYTVNIYNTTFPYTQNPISENNSWLNGQKDGLDWYNAQTNNGRAYGTPSSDAYTDPTAVLNYTAFGKNQSVIGTAFCDSPGSSQEVELRIHSNISAHNINGYEALWNCAGNAHQIVTWNGPLANFSLIAESGSGISNGDIIKMTMFGTNITTYKNGVLQLTGIDGNFTGGSPGIGFNYNNGAGYTLFGFNDFYATDMYIPLQFNYTNTSTISYCWYVIDNNPIVRLTSCANSTLTTAPTFGYGYGTHNITYYANNSTNYVFQSSTIYFTLSNGSDSTAPTVTLNTPVDNYNTSSQTIAFNATGSDSVSLKNMSIYGNWTGSWVANQTNSSPINNTLTTFNISGFPAGKYNWNVYACDNSNNCAFAGSNRTFTVYTGAINYYVNATTGSDSNDGLTPASAWQTISKVNSMTFNPGDHIYFERGQTWREQLNYPSSGNSTAPITFGAYGSGASPIITASNLITAGWTKNATHIWQAADTTQPFIVYINGTRGTNVSSVAGITTEFNWFWASNVLYVWSPPDTDPSLYYTNPGIEAGTRNQAIRTNDKSYVTVDGLTMRDGNQAHDNTVNVGSANVTGIIFQNCVVERGKSVGFDLKGSTTANSVTINNCTVQNNGGWGISPEYLYTTATISNSIIAGNGWDSVVQNQQYSGIQGLLGNFNIFGNIVYNNGPVCNIAHNCHGIYYPTGATDTVPANIYNNTVYSNPTGSGIKLVGSANVSQNTVYSNAACGVEIGQNGAANVVYSVYSNVIYSNNIDDTGAGICELSKGAGTINLTINNNDLYKNGGAAQAEINILDNVTALTIKNNIFWATNTRRTLSIQTNQTGTVNIDYNLHWSDSVGGDPGIRYGSVYPTWVQWRSWGYDTHGVNANPLFTNAAGNDFTLQSSSPAIDNGTNVGLTTDFAGNPVPSGNAPDIGAYEYQFITTPIAHISIMNGKISGYGNGRFSGY